MATVRRLYLKCEQAVRWDNKGNHHVVLVMIRTAKTGGSWGAVRSVSAKNRPTEQRKYLFNTETYFNSWKLGEIRQHQDRAWDQAVWCRPLTTDTQVQLQAWTCEFVVENVAMGRDSHYEHLATNVPYWVIRLWSTSLNLSNWQLTLG
jgi:hypothetical protein